MRRHEDKEETDFLKSLSKRRQKRYRCLAARKVDHSSKMEKTELARVCARKRDHTDMPNSRKEIDDQVQRKRETSKPSRLPTGSRLED